MRCQGFYKQILAMIMKTVLTVSKFYLSIYKTRETLLYGLQRRTDSDFSISVNLSSGANFWTWPADMGLPFEFQILYLNLLFLMYPQNVTGTKIKIYMASMASVYMLSLICCCLCWSLHKYLPKATATLHVTISTIHNWHVLIYSCTHTITNASIQHSPIMKPQSFGSYFNFIGMKIIHSKRICRTKM